MTDRLLVTGAGGFIGRHVVAALQRTDAEVISVRHRWQSAEELEERVGDGPVTRCIHLGWYTAPLDYLIAAEPNLRSLRDSIALVDFLGARGCRHLVVAGTSAEYAPQSHLLREDDPVGPWSIYGAAKACLLMLLESTWSPRGLAVAWARLFNVTGPGEARERLLPTVACSLLRNDEIELSPGDQVRDFLDVRDVAAALVALSTAAASGVFNVSSGQGIALREVLTHLGAMLDRTDLLRFGAKSYAEHDAAYVVGDNARLRDATHWVPRIRSDEMLEAIAYHWRAMTTVDR